MFRVKHIIALTISAGGVLAVWHFCLVPLQCNVQKKFIEDSTIQALRHGGSPTMRVTVARRNLQRLTPCLANRPSDPDLYMEMGANYRLLGQDEMAIAAYEHALRYDRRPEIFLNLGVTRLSVGQEEAGVDALLKAIAFNPNLASSLPAMVGEKLTPQIQERVHQELGNRPQLVRSLLKDFSVPSP